MESPDPRQRLLDLAQQRGASLSALSRLLGRNPSYLQQFVRKGSRRMLAESERAMLARYCSVGEDERGAPEDFSTELDCIRSGQWVDVPRLELGVSAGAGALDPGERAFGTLRFSRQWLRQNAL